MVKQDDEELVAAYEAGSAVSGVKACLVEGILLYLTKKIMALPTMFTALTSNLLVGLHLGERDGLWEITCAPHSWLSEAAEQHGLRPRRLYDHHTSNRLRELRLERRPKRLWLSLPCTKWCPWTSVNFNTPEKKVKLGT